MLIQNGYSSINIKTLAKRIRLFYAANSWYFGNMGNFRNALTEYALHYANEKMLSASEGMSAFANVGMGYIDIAFDEPNLFRYLYMSGESEYHAGNFDILTTADANSVMTEQTAKQLGIPVDKVNDFSRETIIYTHGLACFIVSGLIKKGHKKTNAHISFNHIWNIISSLDDRHYDTGPWKNHICNYQFSGRIHGNTRTGRFYHTKTDERYNTAEFQHKNFQE